MPYFFLADVFFLKEKNKMGIIFSPISRKKKWGAQAGAFTSILFLPEKIFHRPIFGDFKGLTFLLGKIDQKPPPLKSLCPYVD